MIEDVIIKWKKTALSVLVTFVLHIKPKVRKAGQKAVAQLLHGGSVAGGAVDHVAQFCQEELEKSTADAKILHLMTFIRAVLAIFPVHIQKNICQQCTGVLISKICVKLL